MANNFYCRTALIGGASGALDEIDGAGLNDLDFAIVSILNKIYMYSLDDDDGGAESSPGKIQPDANAGTKMWVLQGLGLPLETDLESPTLSFGDENTGFIEESDNNIRVVIAGNANIGFDGNGLKGFNNFSGLVKKGAGSATIPVHSFVGDTDTGMGRAAENELSLIAGAVEGIRVTEVAGVINVLNDGFTKLGSGAPTIKMKKVTGTTGATEGTSTFIAHGLTQSKILSFQVFITSTDLIPPFFTAIAEFQYDVYLESPNVVIMLHSTNSGNLLSKAITVLITYEE